ncbi:MAG: TatD family hydrolase [Chromatiales bacterium]|jgi:TatD DNase family protein|nr:TatD family hydrolase [Chromatiales bacterium]
MLIDIGANLTHESFVHDLDEVLLRAARSGVTRFIATGTTVAGSEAALKLAEQRPGTVWATAGIHPHHAAEFSPQAILDLRTMLGDPRTVAVGECGLDYCRNYAPSGDQRQAFEGQLRIAAECGKPVFLHQRDAHDEFLRMLRDYRPSISGGVAHCFTEGSAELDDYLDLGLYIGITGWICDERRGADLRAAIATLPLDRLLLETDAPYLLPRTLSPKPRTRRNEPAYLTEVLRVVAERMQQTIEVVATASSRNAERLFRLAG